MRVAFVHDWPIHFEQEYTWRDGLAAAVKELGKRHEVKFFAEGQDCVIPHPYFPVHVCSDIPSAVAQFCPDAIISWGDCTRPNAAPLSELGKPHALCFAGGDPLGPTAMHYDHFFVESQVYFDKFSAAGKSVSTAFGTNTDLFQPLPNQQKVFDVCFPATFADWKRHTLFADATRGLRAVVAGYMYHDHEQYCWEACEKSGALVLPHLSAEATHRLMAASKVVLITSKASGGSQRTTLEAMAMNIPVIVMEDSDKTSEYVREGGGWIVRPEVSDIKKALEEAMNTEVNTRDYILSKWSHINYADAMDHWLSTVDFNTKIQNADI